MSTRLTDATKIEQRLLELAYTTDAKLTASALAYFAPCSIENAERVLDDLAGRDSLSIEVDDAGGVYYKMAGRQKISSPSAPLSMPAGHALISTRHRRDASPALAAVLALVFPGAGHAYTGRIAAALLWFLFIGLGYLVIVPGLILHLFSIASAASSANRLNAENARHARPLLLNSTRWPI